MTEPAAVTPPIAHSLDPLPHPQGRKGAAATRAPGFHFTVDVDWIPGSEKGVLLLLELCDRLRLAATFFVVGRFAEAHPDLVREMLRRGHEVGSHGWEHGVDAEENFGRSPREEQRRRLILAGEAIARATGSPPVLFRAPNLWVSEAAHELLVELGYRLDSSVPARRFDFGYGRVKGFRYHRAPLEPYHPSPGHLARRGDSPILEVPPSAFACIPVNMSALRVLGHRPVAWAARSIARRGLPLVFYSHPAEFVRAEEQCLPPGDPARHRKDLGPHHLAKLERFVRLALDLGRPSITLGSLLADDPQDRHRHHRR